MIKNKKINLVSHLKEVPKEWNLIMYKEMKIYNKNKKKKEDIHKNDYSKVKIDLKD